MRHCPSEQQLERAFAGDGSTLRQRAIRRHADSCDSCRAWLAQASADDLLLSDLARVAADSSFRSAIAGLDTVPESPSSTPLPIPEVGAHVGGYELLSRLGEGGMGVVFEARQQQPQRNVALKLMGSGRLDPERVRMFQREVAALARFQHAAIATIYESGSTADGIQYFAMELVREGEPISRYADTRALGVRSRLELFCRVCAAVSYAHQRGVSHLDLKPSNILITPDGTPKVLDFGLARIADEPAGGDDSPARPRVRGSLPYMSPEQTTGMPNATDLRSDVYSLGVILYELLTGRLPYDTRRPSVGESLAVIRECVPLRPSATRPALRGDLDAIVLKALSKRPDDRYASVAALAEDLERHLKRLPVLARSPTLRYQFGRLILRYKLPFAALGVGIASLAAAAVGFRVLYELSQTNLRRAEGAEHAASTQARRAEQEAISAIAVRDLLLGIVGAQQVGGDGEAPDLLTLLDRAAERLGSGVEPDSLALAARIEAIGDAFSRLGHENRARPNYEKSVWLRRALAGEDPRPIADACVKLANTCRALGDLPAAEAALREALTIYRLELEDEDPHVLAVLSSLGGVLTDGGDDAAAEPILVELVRIARASPDAHSKLAANLNALAGALEAQGRFGEAAALMREALADALLRYGDDHYVTATVKSNLAWLLAHTGALEEAETLVNTALETRRRWLPADHPMIASSLLTLGTIQMTRGEFAAAQPLLRDCYRIRTQTLPDSAPAAEAALAYANCLHALDRHDEAQRLAVEILSMPDATQRNMAEAKREARALLVRLSAPPE